MKHRGDRDTSKGMSRDSLYGAELRSSHQRDTTRQTRAVADVVVAGQDGQCERQCSGSASRGGDAGGGPGVSCGAGLGYRAVTTLLHCHAQSTVACPCNCCHCGFNRQIRDYHHLYTCHGLCHAISSADLFAPEHAFERLQHHVTSQWYFVVMCCWLVGVLDVCRLIGC